MKIEVGKLYRTRSGRKVRIYATDGGGETPIHGAIYYPELNQWNANLWGQSGSDSEGITNFDIVSEWGKKLNFDPDCLPKLAKWVAMDQRGNWYWFDHEPFYNGITWVANLRGEIHPKFAPKNFTGDWQESLFTIDELSN